MTGKASGMKIRSTHTCVKSSQNIAVFKAFIIGISSKSAKAGVSKVWWSLRTKEFRMKLLISGGSTKPKRALLQLAADSSISAIRPA